MPLLLLLALACTDPDKSLDDTAADTTGAGTATGTTSAGSTPAGATSTGATPTGTATGTTPTGTPTGALGLHPQGLVENGRFSTAGACEECHRTAASATALKDAAGRTVGMVDLWEGSMMANAGRDPLWRAVVSAEVAATPAAAAAIESKCMTCHTPMAVTDARLVGDPDPGLDVIASGTERGHLATDGVSCTVCHQIEPDGLGTPDSLSGGYTILGEGRAYGPHDDPFDHPMEEHSGFLPESSDHVMDSALCATCHTLTTDALAEDGTPTGGQVLEQAPWLEWAASGHDEAGTSCQDCHLPTTDADGDPIETRIARNPGGMDFPPTSPRTPFGRHLLVGGNTLIPAILRDNRDALQPWASDAAFDGVIAEARAQLADRSATVTVDAVDRSPGALSFTVEVQPLTGHKLPTGIPLRRAWLRVVVEGADGVRFVSGDWDGEGRILTADGAVQGFEAVGGPLAPHVDAVSDGDAVPVYEAVLADGTGAPTWRLMRGEGWAKDTRLLPWGWDPSHDPALAPVGVDGDADWTTAGDRVHYTVDPGEGPVTVTAELVYQPLAPRFAAELFAVDTPEVRAFQAMYDAADRTPEAMGAAVVEVP